MLVGDARLEPSPMPIVDRRHSGTEAVAGLPTRPEQVHADGGRVGSILLGPVTILPSNLSPLTI